MSAVLGDWDGPDGPEYADIVKALSQLELVSHDYPYVKVRALVERARRLLGEYATSPGRRP